MKIIEKTISIRQLYSGYIDDEENGVWGYSGKLNIRPAFQREFIYDAKRKESVINTVMKHFPLNIMYWTIGRDEKYELLDGQQRTLSICKYIDNQYSINVNGMPKKFENLSITQQEEILNYSLKIYVCDGTEDEKTEWFETINIAGLTLKNQEILNAVYRGPWISDAKKYFSKNNCLAYKIGENYLIGELDRQDYLECVLKWISSKENKTIKEYMSEHQNDAHATPLWQYFQNVISWVQTIFPKYRKKLMKGIQWGILYNQYGKNIYNPQTLEKEIQTLIGDDFVSNHKGIYEYLLSGKSKQNCLNIRAFSEKEKIIMYERQKGLCPICLKEGRSIVDKDHPLTDAHWEIDEMHADHKEAWSKFGPTILENGQMLCAKHNREKSNY